MSDQTPEIQATESPVQLQLSDLLLAAQVIQLASQRGAVRAEEMTQVGGLYERLVTFLQASGALKTVDASSAPTSDETVSTEPPVAE
jgi:hypothetical protein